MGIVYESELNWPKMRIDMAFTATEKLSDEAFNLVGFETKQFFDTVKWPDTRAKPTQ